MECNTFRLEIVLVSCAETPKSATYHKDNNMFWALNFFNNSMHNAMHSFNDIQAHCRSVNKKIITFLEHLESTFTSPFSVNKMFAAAETLYRPLDILLRLAQKGMKKKNWILSWFETTNITSTSVGLIYLFSINTGCLQQFTEAEASWWKPGKVGNIDLFEKNNKCRSFAWYAYAGRF